MNKIPNIADKKEKNSLVGRYCKLINPNTPYINTVFRIKNATNKHVCVEYKDGVKTITTSFDRLRLFLTDALGNVLTPYDSQQKTNYDSNQYSKVGNVTTIKSTGNKSNRLVELKTKMKAKQVIMRTNLHKNMADLLDENLDNFDFHERDEINGDDIIMKKNNVTRVVKLHDRIIEKYEEKLNNKQ